MHVHACGMESPIIIHNEFINLLKKCKTGSYAHAAPIINMTVCLIREADEI